MSLNEHQKIHRQMMQAICEIIQEDGKPLVLKGGTALLLGYDLKRFSEDLDFDLTKELKSHVNIEAICRAAQRKLRRQGINDDPLLQGKLFDDLGTIERWVEARRNNENTLKLFGAS
ncbi:MAG: nucleotidyl transferase AbiEii/AbiGii toxin family protein [Marinobacter sp.]